MFSKPVHISACCWLVWGLFCALLINYGEILNIKSDAALFLITGGFFASCIYTFVAAILGLKAL